MQPENPTEPAPVPPLDQRHVFVSFASNDVAVARRVVASLEQSGLRCWFSDRDIEPAHSYPAAITDAVKASGALLLLLTDASNQSPHVIREVELAFTGRRPILPVRIGGAAPSPDLQYFLSRSQWLDVGASIDDAELATLASRLRLLIRRGWGPPVDGRSWLRIAVVGTVVATGVASLLVWNQRRASEQPFTTTTATTPALPADATTPAPITARVNAKDGESYMWIPPGKFIMGCSAGDAACQDDERPAHTVEIERGFWLARTEVLEQRFRTPAARANQRAPTAGTLPATGVAWRAAKAYCEAVGGRLPTEAEWEYAARAGTASRYYDRLPAIAWFSENSDGAPHAVGGKMPNAFGLHDMLGNVSEWVLDRYYNAYDETSDPIDVEQPLAGNASGIARGGSWVSDEDGVRVSRRLQMEPDAEEPHIGFRCAVDDLGAQP
jgi:formylglycine-generating enzyme required for sulfatase activity